MAASSTCTDKKFLSLRLSDSPSLRFYILNFNYARSLISDDLTKIQMKEDWAQLKSAERIDGLLDIAATPLYVVVPFMLIVKPIMGLSKIIAPVPEEMAPK